MRVGERYVLIGLATAQGGWFVEVARWATSGVIAAEFLKASTVEEVAARLRSGRPVSAVLVGSSVVGWDRDLAGLAATNGCAVVLIEDRRALTRPEDFERTDGSVTHGSAARERSTADASLPAQFDRDRLLQVLEQVAQPVARADDAPGVDLAAWPHPGSGANGGGSGKGTGTGQWRGRLVAVTGAGGTGSSTLAMALAVGLAADPRDRHHVLLADLALRAQQAVLHDSGDVLPGLPELVEAYRREQLGPDGVRSLCFEVPEGGYDLLLGLRNQREWTALHAHSVGAAMTGLRSTYRLVVADVDADVEGEEPTGSVDLEERNLLARTSLAQADLVLVVGRAGLTGTHRLVELLSELLRYGLAPERLLPIVNRAPKRAARRAEACAAVQAHANGRLTNVRFAANPYCVSERRGLDDLIADGGVMPGPFCGALAQTVRALLDRNMSPPDRLADTNGAVPEPARVEPGSVGRWTEELTGDLER